VREKRSKTRRPNEVLFLVSVEEGTFSSSEREQKDLVVNGKRALGDLDQNVLNCVVVQSELVTP
jgi:hypothetical protein